MSGKLLLTLEVKTLIIEEEAEEGDSRKEVEVEAEGSLITRETTINPNLMSKRSSTIKKRKPNLRKKLKSKKRFNRKERLS